MMTYYINFSKRLENLSTPKPWSLFIAAIRAIPLFVQEQAFIPADVRERDVKNSRRTFFHAAE